MDLMDSLKVIKVALKKSDFHSSHHFKEKCSERNLDFEAVKTVVNENKILGITEQDESQNLYKIWFYYEESKDLNIILKIERDNNLKLITIFPCLSERRKK